MSKRRGKMEEQNQLEFIGAKKLWDHHRECGHTLDDSVTLPEEPGVVVKRTTEFEDLNSDRQKYWIDLFNTAASEIGKIFSKSNKDSLEEIEHCANQQAKKLRGKKDDIKNRLAAVKTEINLLQDEVEEQMRGQAAIAFLKHRYHDTTEIDSGNRAIQDIIYGDVDSSGFQHWYK